METKSTHVMRCEAIEAALKNAGLLPSKRQGEQLFETAHHLMEIEDACLNLHRTIGKLVLACQSETVDRLEVYLLLADIAGEMNSHLPNHFGQFRPLLERVWSRLHDAINAAGTDDDELSKAMEARRNRKQQG